MLILSFLVVEVLQKVVYAKFMQQIEKEGFFQTRFVHLSNEFRRVG